MPVIMAERWGLGMIQLLLAHVYKVALWALFPKNIELVTVVVISGSIRPSQFSYVRFTQRKTAAIPCRDLIPCQEQFVSCEFYIIPSLRVALAAGETDNFCSDFLISENSIRRAFFRPMGFYDRRTPQCGEVLLSISVALGEKNSVVCWAIILINYSVFPV